MTKVTSLFRPSQLSQNRTDLQRLEKVASDPFLLRGVSDKEGLHKLTRRLKQALADHTPTPFAETERDAMVKRAEALKAKFTTGMPTAAEMRKSPPGAVGKHMAWEKRNKTDILEWKYITRRLDPENEDPDLTNIEMFRRHGGSDELSMDNAFIPGNPISLPAVTPTPGAVASDTELEVLHALDPDLADSFATLDGPQRAQVLGLIRTHIENVAKAADPKPKRERTPERIAADKAKMAKARAARSWTKAEPLAVAA